MRFKVLTVVLVKIQVFWDIPLCQLVNNYQHSWFCHVLNVAFFLLGDSLISEFCVSTFRNTLSVPSSRVVKALKFLLIPPMKMGQSVPKCRHIKCRCQGITQMKEYNYQHFNGVYLQSPGSPRRLHTCITQTLQTEATSSSKTLVSIYQWTWGHIQ